VKVIPFGLETFANVNTGTSVVLCCGEEDALSLRPVGYTALSQPGAGLLEPVYSREMAGLGVVVLYDAGEASEARRDAQKLLEAGAESVRVAEWAADAPNGADVNGKLVEDPRGFARWAAGMIEGAKPVSRAREREPQRDGVPDVYLSSLEMPEPKWPELDDAARYGLPGEIVGTMEPHTEADPVALLGSLLCAFGNAIGRGASVKPPQARREEMRPLSRDQVGMFLDTVKGDRMEALYVLAVTSGLRQGELLALKWEDVDLEGTNPTLEVRRNLSETRGRRSFVTPKSGRGRHLRLSRRAVSALGTHRKRQLEERVRKAGLWEDHGLIFPSEIGTPMSGRNLYRAFKIRIKRASLPQTLRFHDLRHTCATLLLRQGVNPKFVQELLGHADISLTLNTYSHVLPDMGDAAAGGMDAALG
jgi:integrase